MSGSHQYNQKLPGGSSLAASKGKAAESVTKYKCDWCGTSVQNQKNPAAHYLTKTHLENLVKRQNSRNKVAEGDPQGLVWPPGYPQPALPGLKVQYDTLQNLRSTPKQSMPKAGLMLPPPKPVLAGPSSVQRPSQLSGGFKADFATIKARGEYLKQHPHLDVNPLKEDPQRIRDTLAAMERLADLKLSNAPRASASNAKASASREAPSVAGQKRRKSGSPSPPSRPANKRQNA